MGKGSSKLTLSRTVPARGRGWEGTGTKFRPLSVPQWQWHVVLCLVSLKGFLFPEEESQFHANVPSCLSLECPSPAPPQVPPTLWGSAQALPCQGGLYWWHCFSVWPCLSDTSDVDSHLCTLFGDSWLLLP